MSSAIIAPFPDTRSSIEIPLEKGQPLYANELRQANTSCMFDEAKDFDELDLQNICYYASLVFMN